MKWQMEVEYFVPAKLIQDDSKFESKSCFFYCVSYNDINLQCITFVNIHVLHL